MNWQANESIITINVTWNDRSQFPKYNILSKSKDTTYP